MLDTTRDRLIEQAHAIIDDTACCNHCRGSGRSLDAAVAIVEVVTGICERCGGTGEIEVNRLSPKGEYREDVPMVCGECNGTGKAA